MKNLRNRFFKNLRYLCLIGIIFLGLMTIIGIGSSGATSVSNISLDSAYLQFRTYSDISNNQYRGWLEFSENGSSINESDITQILLKDAAGNSVSIESTSFYASSNYWGYWNSSTSSIEISGPYPFSGFSISFPDGTNLSQGNYTYEGTTSQGSLLTRAVYFPGETTLPVVDDTSMSYEWLGDGGLHLTWTNPSGTYDQLRVVLMDQDWDDLLSLRLLNNVNDITIPNEWIQKIKDFKNPSSAKWQIQTRSYTDTGENNNYARGISDAVDIDMTSPTVNSTNPSNNATDVAVNTDITATFSEEMDSSTITTTTFSVNDGSTDIVGTITYSGTTATFTPTSDLDYDTSYTATITTGAKDLAGNAIQANYTWSFTTGSDTTPPTVSSAYPVNNTVDLSVTTTITATFSETMDFYTIGPDTFWVSGSGNISGTVTYSGTTATFTPTTNLDYGKTYTATITTGAKDSAGNALQTDYTWSFTTQSGSSNGGGDEGSGACFITTLFENN